MSEIKDNERREFMKTTLLCGAAAGCSAMLAGTDAVAADANKEASGEPQGPAPVKLKITVLKRTLNEELAKEYCQGPVTKCEALKEGQEFIYTQFGGCPKGFCDWAWEDIGRFIMTIQQGGSFNGYMKKNGQLVACCTDGIRPVIFNIEKI